MRLTVPDKVRNGTNDMRNETGASRGHEKCYEDMRDDCFFAGDNTDSNRSHAKLKGRPVRLITCLPTRHKLTNNSPADYDGLTLTRNSPADPSKINKSPAVDSD